MNKRIKKLVWTKMSTEGRYDPPPSDLVQKWNGKIQQPSKIDSWGYEIYEIGSKYDTSINYPLRYGLYERKFEANKCYVYAYFCDPRFIRQDEGFDTLEEAMAYCQSQYEKLVMLSFDESGEINKLEWNYRETAISDYYADWYGFVKEPTRIKNIGYNITECKALDPDVRNTKGHKVGKWYAKQYYKTSDSTFTPPREFDTMEEAMAYCQHHYENDVMESFE